MTELQYMMTIDKRSLDTILLPWRMEAITNRLIVLIICSVTLIIVFLTLSNTLPYVAYNGLIVLAVRSMLRILINNDLLTALIVRHTGANKIYAAVLAVLDSIIMWNYNKTLDRQLRLQIEKQFDKEINRHNIPIKHTDKMLGKWGDYEIDPYWVEKGLKKEKLIKEAANIRLRAMCPEKPKEKNRLTFDTRKHLGKQIVLHQHAVGWEASDMTDNMHVKSIYKRIVGIRYPYIIEKQREFTNILIKLADELPKVEVTEENAIMKALGTSGTAGQFAKRSTMEEIWKDKSNEMGVELWYKITRQIRLLVMLTDKMPQALIQYMLYRKAEALPVENGEIKVTRLMNAPNLVARVTDCKPFMPLNDAMVLARSKTIGKVGMNIFIELKMLLIYNPEYEGVVQDFKDYDGSQTATQIYACGAMRVKYMNKYSQSIDEVCYMLSRYNSHVRRNVRSTFGIEYDTIGQQASGDITTTDDNTAKSATQAKMADKELLNYVRKNKVYAEKKSMIVANACMGDDTLKILRKNDLTIQELEKILGNCAKDIGWTIKEGSLERHPMMQDGKLFFMSHAVSRKKFLSDNDAIVIQFAVLYREKGRLAGKWAIAAEMEDDLSVENCAKLASKYLTMAMVSIGNPLCIASSLYMLLWLRASSAKFHGPYSWSGFSADTIESIKLNKMVELQLGVRFTRVQLTKIHLNDEEVEMVQQQVDEINKLISSYKDKKMLGKGEPKYIKKSITDNWWDYEEVREAIETTMRMLAKTSHVRGKAGHKKWWEQERKIKDNIKELDGFQPVKLCEHSSNIGVIHKNKYLTTQKCLTCWQKDTEEVYKGINFCLYTKIQTDYSESKGKNQVFESNKQEEKQRKRIELDKGSEEEEENKRPEQKAGEEKKKSEMITDKERISIRDKI